jgi:hypothetical protein
MLRTLFCPQPPSSHTLHLLPGLIRSTCSAAAASAPQFSKMHYNRGRDMKSEREREGCRNKRKGGIGVGIISDMTLM